MVRVRRLPAKECGGSGASRARGKFLHAPSIEATFKPAAAAAGAYSRKPGPLAPGVHASGGRSADEWLRLIHEAADGEEKLFPLPPLRRPEQPQSRGSPRIHARWKDKMTLWRLAVAAASAQGWCYFGARRRCVFGGGRPLALAEMRPHHRGAWESLLEEARSLRVARRASALTGGAAFETLVRSSDRVYGQIAPPAEKYYPLGADRFAEPSRPAQTVPMLQALPPVLSEYYASEERVLAGGGVDPEVISELKGGR